jgi:hypothetical protein
MQPLAALDRASLRREMRRFSHGGAVAEIPDMRRVPWWQSKVDRFLAYDLSAAQHVGIQNLLGGIQRFLLACHHPAQLQIGFTRRHRNVVFYREGMAAITAGNVQTRHDQPVIINIPGAVADMLEKIQATLHLEAPVPNQGSYESFNRLVERWYTALMETEHGI